MSMSALHGSIAAAISAHLGGGGGSPIGPYVPEVIGSHRYWSINIAFSADRNSTLGGLDELEFRATVGGADLTTPGGPLTMSFAVRDGSLAAIIDNNPTTTYCQWENGAAGTKNRIAYDFASPVSIAEVAISPNKDAHARSPGDFTLDYSDDGVVWTTGPRIIIPALSYTSIATGQFVVINVEPPADAVARYWMMDDIVSLSPSSMAEIELHGTIGGADVTTPTSLIYASDVFSGSFEGSNAFDDNVSTFWAASNTSGGFITIDLDSGITSDCVELSLTSRSTFASQAIRSGTMYFSKMRYCYWKRGSWTADVFTDPQSTQVVALQWP